jgi:hypothetical protein
VIKRLSKQGNTNELISYLLVAACYALSVFVGRKSPSVGATSFLMMLRPSEAFLQWAVPLLSIIGGLVLAFSTNRLFSRHKILGARTNAPIIVSGLFGSLLPNGNYGGVWILITLLLVWLFDAIFNLQEHEKRNLNSILFSGTVLSVIVMLNKSTIWLIPVIFLAIALFLFLNVRRISTLIWAGFIPFFILATVLFTADNVAPLQSFITNAYWRSIHFGFNTQVEQFISLIVLHIPIVIGLFMMIFNYNSNASKQRKIYLLLISTTIFFLLGGFVFQVMKFPDSGLLTLPAIACSSYLYVRGQISWLLNLVFYLHLLAWGILLFQPDIMGMM